MRTAALVPLAALLAACGPDPSLQAEHACSHVGLDGDPIPAAATEADTAGGDADLPVTEHGVWRIEGLGGADGWLRIAMDQTVRARLFFGQESDLRELLRDGEPATLPGAVANSACPQDIPEDRTLDLEPADWLLRFGPDAPPTLWAMLVPDQ